MSQIISQVVVSTRLYNSWHKKQENTPLMDSCSVSVGFFIGISLGHLPHEMSLPFPRHDILQKSITVRIPAIIQPVLQGHMC